MESLPQMGQEPQTPAVSRQLRSGDAARGWFITCRDNEGIRTATGDPDSDLLILGSVDTSSCLCTPRVDRSEDHN
eukprot:103462-Amphidinium_carterae.1